MNLVKEYLILTGKTQKEVVAEFRKIDKKYDKSIVSKMVNGFILPNEELTTYIEIKLKAVATKNKGDKNQNRVIIPITNENRLKTKIEEQIFNALPMARKDLVQLVGIDDRTVRDVINRMQDNGIRIIQKNGMYKIAESDQEFNEYKPRYLANAYTMIRRWNAMANSQEGQYCYE